MSKSNKSPLVSVVIITYNDAVNLPNAIKSVQNQTLNNLEIIVVDDYSGDNTDDLVSSFKLSDNRIRYIRRENNSGGCGAPRNDGIDAAKGKYIFFLDSDDELERHALKNLYFAAIRDAADFVMGETVRYNLVSKKERAWLPYLFKEEVRDINIVDYPDLVDDALSTNKLYKTSFLIDNNIRFVVDVHFEDIIFSSLVFTKAKKITILPDVIYIWKVYPIVERKSISNQRDTEKSIRDRIFAIKLREDIYASLKNEPVMSRHYVNFLKHSAMLYLMDSVDYTDSHIDTVIKVLKPEIESLPNKYFDELEAHERVMYAMLLLEDKTGLKELSYYRKYGKRLAGKFVNEDSRVYWISSGAEATAEDVKIKNLQDVTNFYIQQTPVSECVYLHEVTSIKRNKGSVEVHAISQDPLQKFNFSKSIKTDFIISKRGKESVHYVFPATTYIRGQKIHWKVKIKDFNFTLKFGYEPWDCFIRLNQDNRINISPILMPDTGSKKGVTIHSTTLIRRSIGVELEVYRTINGNIALRHIEGFRRRKVMGLYKKVTRLNIKLSKLRKRVKRRVIEKYAYPAARKLPIDKRLIFFESQLGQMPIGSPRAIYDNMKQDSRFYKYKFVWSVAAENDISDRRTKCIERESWRYFWTLSRAAILIEDQTLPRYFIKRKGQLYIETWHGVPFKKMGLDEPKIQRSTRLSKSIVNRAKAWDALVVPSQYFIDTFVKSYKYTGHLLKYGTPRNDRLITAPDNPSIKEKLDLPKDRKIILYTPTFRETSRVNGGKFELPFDIQKWREQLGGDTYLLVRTHYLNKVSIPKIYAQYCMNVSDYEDINELYLVSDLMITDYSSTMFDYVTLRRPMIFYAYDYDDYTQSERGSYFDLMEDAPGPVVLNEEDLYDVVKKSINQGSITIQYGKFLNKYCANEDGRSSERIIDYIAKRTRV